MIDKASVFAERFKGNPQILQATVLGQGTDPNLDPYTALRALQLIKESNAMAMAQQAQGPTSAPSLASQAVEPQGLAGMLPMGAPAGQMPQGQAPQQMAQAPAMQASGGLAGLPTPEEDYAAGGIVAFSGPTEENNYSLVSDLTVPPNTPYSEDESGLYPTESGGEGNAGMQARAFANYERSRKELEELTGQTTTADDDRKTRKDYLDFLEANAGPNIYAPATGRLDAREADRAKNVRQGQGLALLAAAGAILEGNTLARGASKAFPVFAKEMGEVQRADIAEQRSIETMRFALADAQRKERMGDVRGAQAAAETARKAKADANKFQFDKTKALADLDAKAIQATRPRTGAGAGGPKLAERLADAEEAFALNPTKENRARLQALSSAASKMKTSFSTSEVAPEKARVTTAPVQQRIDADVAKGLGDFKFENKTYRKAVRDKNEAEAQRLLDAEEARLRGVAERSQTAVTPAGRGGATSTPKPGTVINYDANGKRIN
jgi:hypothetical protein